MQTLNALQVRGVWWDCSLAFSLACIGSMLMSWIAAKSPFCVVRPQRTSDFVATVFCVCGTLRFMDARYSFVQWCFDSFETHNPDPPCQKIKSYIYFMFSRHESDFIGDTNEWPRWRTSLLRRSRGLTSLQDDRRPQSGWGFFFNGALVGGKDGRKGCFFGAKKSKNYSSSWMIGRLITCFHFGSHLFMGRGVGGFKMFQTIFVWDFSSRKGGEDVNVAKIPPPQKRVWDVLKLRFWGCPSNPYYAWIFQVNFASFHQKKNCQNI